MEKGRRGKAAPRLRALAVGGELVECITFIQVSLGEFDVNDCGYTFFLSPLIITVSMLSVHAAISCQASLL